MFAHNKSSFMNETHNKIKIKERCYIAGKIGDWPEEKYLPLFEQGKKEVEKLGFTPVSPTDLPHNHARTWATFMMEDLTAMFTCTTVYALSNWRHSPGATDELNTALKMGLNIIHQK